MLGRKLIQVAMASFVLFSMLALQCPGKTPPATEDESQEQTTAEPSLSPDLDEEWTLKGDTGWLHMTGFSYFCWFLDTDPVPGAPFVVRITGPGVDDTPEQSGALNSEGKASGRFRIVQYGEYTIKASVMEAGETQEIEKRGEVVAGPAPGSCQQLPTEQTTPPLRIISEWLTRS